MDGVPSSSTVLVNLQPEEYYTCVPQEVWRHIASFLPMHDAVRTSIISRSWRQIWYSFPNLIFNYRQFPDEMEEKEEKFVDFVNGTLVRHDMSNINSFEIEMPVTECYTELQNEWIAFAIVHNVQNLYLNGKMDQFHGIPKNLFMSESLTRIHLVLPEFVLKRQEQVFLPSLKELRLRAIVIADCLKETLEGCPALEHLWIVHCSFKLLKSLTISSSSLKHLTISHCEGVETCKLRIQTPILIKLRIVDFIAWDYEFLSNSYPDLGFISFADPYPLERSMVDMGMSAFNLYRGFYKARGFVFYPWFIEFLSWSTNFVQQIITPSFDHLDCLNLFIWPIKSHIDVMLLILSKSPNVHCVEIVMMTPRENPSNDALILTHPPESSKYSGIVNQLTRASIYRFDGNADELALVKIFLENAPKLENLKLSKEYGLGRTDLQDPVGISIEIRDKIHGFNRLSKDVTITFC